MGFAALDGSGKEFGMGKDIAGEDLGGAQRHVGIEDVAKTGRNMLRHFKGMERGVERGWRKKKIPRFARNESLVVGGSLVVNSTKRNCRGDLGY